MRNRKKKPKILMLLLGAGLVVMLAVGGYVISSGGGPGNGFTNLPELQPDQYRQQGTQLRNNTYRMDGTIEYSLGDNPEVGHLVSVLLDSSEGMIPVAALILPETKEVNIEKGQRYRMIARISPQGIIQINQMEKL